MLVCVSRADKSKNMFLFSLVPISVAEGLKRVKKTMCVLHGESDCKIITTKNLCNKPSSQFSLSYIKLIYKIHKFTFLEFELLKKMINKAYIS